MAEAVSERDVEVMLEAIYDAALSPEAWPVLLERLAKLFDSHFADLFTRSHDRTRYSGVAFGLDRADYQEQFLDTWFKRNVWGISKPTRDAGEVLSTRQMLDISDLIGSEIYTDYLNPRGLHEGLRLAVWSDQDGIQDISLLRPWSAGAFGPEEIALGQRLLPHLQRAAAVARRLCGAEAASQTGLLALEAAGFALVLLDRMGRPVLLNGPAERIVREQDGLTIEGQELRASSSTIARAFRRTIARGLHADPLQRAGATLRIPRPRGGADLTVVTIPLRRRAEWMFSTAPDLMVLFSDPRARGPSAEQLGTLFGLTEAEAELAELLLAGHDLRAIAQRRSRSIHTVRNHLARLMSKTDTTRQTELAGLLRSIPSERVGQAPAAP